LIDTTLGIYSVEFMTGYVSIYDDKMYNEFKKVLEKLGI
jgi:hypothetical protein